ncbi:Hsp33 family molecular chaperone HslO [Kaarinaea lacus]
MSSKDSLQRFLFEHADVRGEVVRLNATWQEVLQRHAYPEPVKKILGEMMAASALLSAMLKFEGSLIMQIQGSGPLTLAVAECTSQRTLRAIANWHDDIVSGTLKQLVGQGSLAITIEPNQGRRYQGIVDVGAGDLSKAIEDYMHRSQQLETKMWLTVDDSQAAGLLLQKLPEPEGPYKHVQLDEDADAWNRITTLADTVRSDELANLPFEELLRRLFYEEDVRVFEAEPVSFRCSCSKDRVRNTLKMLGYEEITSLFEERSTVSVNCEFCNHLYEFDRVDIEELFASDVKVDSSQVKH